MQPFHYVHGAPLGRTASSPHANGGTGGQAPQNESRHGKSEWKRTMGRIWATTNSAWSEAAQVKAAVNKRQGLAYNSSVGRQLSTAKQATKCTEPLSKVLNVRPALTAHSAQQQGSKSTEVRTLYNEKMSMEADGTYNSITFIRRSRVAPGLCTNDPCK